MNRQDSTREQAGRISFPAVIVILSVIVIFAVISGFAQYQVRKPSTQVGQQVSISITDPANNTTWEKGQRHTIRWTSQGTIASVQIVLVDQAGESHDLIRRTTNSGLYAYSVARTLADGTYRLKISSADGKVKAESSGLITIRSVSGKLGEDHPRIENMKAQGKSMKAFVSDLEADMMVCGAGRVNVNGECQTLVVCGEGTTNVNNTCVPTGGTTCGEGTEEVNGLCVPSELSCEPGTSLSVETGVCVPDFEDVCEPGTSLSDDGDICVPDSEEVCGPGEILEDGTCHNL